MGIAKALNGAPHFDDAGAAADDQLELPRKKFGRSLGPLLYARVFVPRVPPELRSLAATQDAKAKQRGAE
jgi:hypothetical protein